MSKHKHIDKEGYKTLKEFDSETIEFIKQNNFISIRTIECYYSETDGIYGFFTHYDNPLIDDSILNKKDSFYNEFKNQILERIKMREIITQHKLISKTITLDRMEYIKTFNICYDENSHRITALRFTTNLQKITIGKSGEMNKKSFTNIFRNDCFIPGFKTSYVPDVNICYLSYLQVYYENENNLEKYFKPKSENRLIKYFRNKYNAVINFTESISKLILILFVIIFPFYYILKSSQNLYGGEVKIPDEITLLTNRVKIHTDSNGFVHIKADSREDSYFALGFVNAKERLWQMDFLRRTSRGKLSEIFGVKTKQLDIMMRSMGMNEISEKYSNQLKSNSKYIQYLNEYIKGVNYYANNFILPLEYQIFRADWSNWELEDSLAVANFQILTLTHDWNMEIWYKLMEESLGKEFADLVVSFRDVNYPYANETIVNDEELMKMNKNRNGREREEIVSDDKIKQVEEIRMKREKEREQDLEKTLKDKAVRMALEELEKQELEMRRKESEKNKTQNDILNNIQNNTQNDILNNNIKIENNIKKENQNNINDIVKQAVEKSIETLNLSDYDDDEEEDSDSIQSTIPLTSQGASNSWVISGNLTSSGKPILSNDPHLSNSMPSLYFIVKLYLPNDTLVGGLVPGIPIFLTGANRHLSWGVTTENSDAADICEEKIEDDFYIYDNKKYRLTKRQEIVKIKGYDDEIINIKYTRNGPILPPSFPKELLVVNLPFKYETALSFRFAYQNFEATLTDFLFALNFAETPEDFKKEIDHHAAPNLNLAYATRDGEIGWLPVGTFPQKNYINRFCRGYSSEDDIKKYISRSELPSLKNPEKGFLVTANNKFASFNFTYNMTGFHNHVRAFRIRKMIEERISNLTKFTIEENIEMLKDEKDALAEFMLPQILKIVERNLISKTNMKNLKYFNELKNWDFVMRRDSNIPTIYSTLELFIGKQLLTNKISDQKARGIMSLLHYWNFISGVINKIDNGERVDLKQCAHLSGNINCEKYIVYIFNNLDQFLNEIGVKDKNGNILKWGEVKFNHHAHPPLDLVPLVNRLFSRDVPTGGNRNTVKIARGMFNHDKGQFIATHSPRLRFVCDMIEPTRPYMIIDAGNSGNVMSRFYDNLLIKNEEVELIQIKDINFDNIDGPSQNTMILSNRNK